MVGCAVVGCNNTQNTPDVSFHCIPKDERRREFVRRLGRADQKDNPSWRVCSKHFTDDAYERNALHEYVYTRGQVKKLSRDALPTVKLPVALKPDQHDTPRSLRASKRRRAPTPECVDYVIATSESLNTPEPEWIQQRRQNTRLSERVKALEAECAMLHAKVKQREEQLQKTRRRALHARTRIRNATASRQAANKAVINIKAKYNKLAKAARRTLSDAQLQVLQGSGKRPRWSDGEIANAVMLRKISKKAYRFAQSKMGLPLPHPRTIERWTANVPARPGFQPCANVLFAYLEQNCDEFRRLAVLSFDEMRLSSTPSYSPKNDCVYVAKQAQTFVIRGLFGKWKSILYYNYDTSATRDLLLRVIEYAEVRGVRIVAVVCDMGPANTAARRELGVSASKSYFSNPTDPSRAIYFFHDVPHAIKLLRNHLFDDGLRMPDGSWIFKSLVKLVIERDGRNELRLLPRVGERHLNVKGNLRQNVRMAAQIFSRKMSMAILHYCSGIPNVHQISELFEIVNDGFDVLNSRSSSDSVSARKPFGYYPHYHTTVLRRFEQLVRTIRFGYREELLPFQEGLLISINSAFDLLQSVKQKYPFLHTIFTSRLNQDVTESTFSQIRSLGRFYDNPSATEFDYRVRLLSILTLGDVSERMGDSAAVSRLLSSARNGALETMPLEEDICKKCSGSDGAPQLHTASDMQTEPLRYLAGYIAYRFQSTHPEMGSKTTQLSPLPNAPDWIAILSKGGLMAPSDSLFRLVLQLEISFLQFYGPTGLHTCRNVVGKLQSFMASNVDCTSVPVGAVRLYARLRTFIRMRYVGASAAAARLARQGQRKLKKFTS